MNISLDPHILKKMSANQRDMDSEMRKIVISYMRLQDLHGENKGLLEFIEKEDDKNTSSSHPT